MTIPSWENPSLGTMKRVALWLVAEVGVGGVFTKTQLRESFPETAQIDRRMRDLRDFGWRIDTNREDPSLEPHEQRFVAQGEPVWEPGKATRKSGATITATERYSLMKADNNMCRSCGIGPGEEFEDTHMVSKLDVARRQVRMPDGRVLMQMVIECNRCRIGARDHEVDLPAIVGRIDRLPQYERKMLAGWVEADARSFSEVEGLWAIYRTLPADARAEVRAILEVR
ncbi:hypothetical protein [Nocardia farcinica]|uniref:hypothetical protein n=1 Tax=Nocardia farcinica TaxID=37329 RepID=UPI002454BF68|nr:hypothetical protein [Nocardia farcinica]